MEDSTSLNFGSFNRSLQTFDKWQNDPVITTVATPAYPISNVEFPTFTVCSQGIIDEVFKAGYIQQFQEYLKEKNITVHYSPYESVKRLNEVINVSINISLIRSYLHKLKENSQQGFNKSPKRECG